MMQAVAPEIGRGNPRGRSTHGYAVSAYSGHPSAESDTREVHKTARVERRWPALLNTRESVDFGCLVLVTAILFIRPTDFVPGLEEVHLYEVAILSCIAVSWDKLVAQLSWDSLRKRPVGLFMFGILGVSILTNMVRFRIDEGMDFFVSFVKVIVYYLLLVGIVNTPKRLGRFLLCLVIIDLVPTSLALLHYRGIINIPAYTTVADFSNKGGELVETQRLVASGFYGDPNDFCEVINPGLLFCVAGLLEPLRGIKRLVWLAPIATFGQALFLTQSRGGFLGTLTGLSTVFWSRFGWWKAMILMVLALPALFVVAGSRMSSISTSETTGQERVQVWMRAIDYLKESPVLGVGNKGFQDLTGYACHNAYLHAYVELGLPGGTLLFAAYFSTLSSLVRLGYASHTARHPEFQRLRPYILGALISYAFGEMSLTHPYEVPTYAMLGLATACVSLGDPEGRISGAVLTAGGLMRMLGASVLFVIALYFFVRFSVAWQ